MKRSLRIALNGTPDQFQRLRELQTTFAAVCNALAPMVQQTRCWNRVALHHMAYRPLRERFPQLGSQMACNVIYSVSRAARRVYQDHGSPYNMARNPGQPLPVLKFGGPVPVYFDRHTLSLKGGEVSLFTQDGRMRFKVDLPPDIERRFREEKLREVVLVATADGFEPDLPVRRSRRRRPKLQEDVRPRPAAGVRAGHFRPSRRPRSRCQRPKPPRCRDDVPDQALLPR